MPILAIRNLTCRFGGLVAVDSASFNVPDGEIVSLIGPNGAGKTTVFNCITGLQRPAGGDVVFDERPVTKLAPHARMRLGIARTFQNIRLFNEMSVLENAMAGQHSRTRSGVVGAILRTRAQRAEEDAIASEAHAALRFVGLEPRAHHLSRTLPYGEQRRLEIARALASHPRLLILDEPAAGMNEQETAALIDVIVRIRDSGVTVLLVEHDMHLVMNVSDHVVVMDQGRVIAAGRADDVRRQPAVIEAYLGVDE
jgi:branched-chain amino acid transport system ATP-binding protein